MLKIIFFLLLICSLPIYSQTENEDKNQFFKNLPFYYDDFLIVAGLNNGGLFFNQTIKETTYGYGSHFGIEHYQSPGMNLFINYGLHFNNTNFRQQSSNIDFSLYRLEAPIFVSYEIPVLREIDFRFLLGVQFSYLLNSTQSTPYTQEQLDSENIFNYQKDEFSKFDAGLFFGLSIERDKYYMRIGSTINVINLDPNEQGMIHQLHITLGSFPLRFLR